MPRDILYLLYGQAGRGCGPLAADKRQIKHKVDPFQRSLPYLTVLIPRRRCGRAYYTLHAAKQVVAALNLHDVITEVIMPGSTIKSSYCGSLQT